MLETIAILTYFAKRAGVYPVVDYIIDSLLLVQNHLRRYRYPTILIICVELHEYLDLQNILLQVFLGFQIKTK